MRQFRKRRVVCGNERAMILSFDTSNYTTSACLFDHERGVVWQKRILLHPPENQRGLRQSDVVFLHTKNFENLLDGFPCVNVNAVVASARPRPIEGSYMPCFLVGKNYGKATANVIGCPFKTFSHQENHIMAALYSSGHMELMSKPFIAFHISGGTSDVLLVQPDVHGITISQLGGSLDLHAGQLIDRIGVKLGLLFPCGKEMEALAQKAEKSVPVKPSVRKFDFHFSGFENKANELIASAADPSSVSKFALDCVLMTLDKVIQNLKESYAELPILMAGGVMSNRYIADSLVKKYDRIYFSEPFYSSDHALGNAVLYDFLYQK